MWRKEKKKKKEFGAHCEVWVTDMDAPGAEAVFVFLCLRASKRCRGGTGVLRNWWIFMLSVPVEWSAPVTNVDRQPSDLNACSPAGQIRLITANEEEEEHGASLRRSFTCFWPISNNHLVLLIAAKRPVPCHGKVVKCFIFFSLSN